MNSASIRSARPEDLPEMRQLLTNGSRFFVNMGIEELPDLFQGTTAAAVHCSRQRMLGFVILQQEEISEALPTHAPARVSLRAAASQSPGAIVRKQFKALFECAERALPTNPSGHLFYSLTDQRWLQASLRETGFSPHDAIRFYERNAPATRPVPQPATLRAANRSDLPRLADVDAAAFDLLWHMGVAELGRLYEESRMEVAENDGEAVGYTALNLHDVGVSRRKSAQLVRLAVHPQAQDLGIGRQLLASSLNHAHAQGINNVFLNTQESNGHAQRLYESVQFRKRGRTVPVYVKRAPVHRDQLCSRRLSIAGPPGKTDDAPIQEERFSPTSLT